MSLKSKLAMMATTVALASVPAMAQNNDKTEEKKSTDTPWYQTAWKYTGSALGEGVSYVGKGISITGDGIAWTMDKITYPVRKTGEVLKSANDVVGDYVFSVEKKTHIPMGMVTSIVRSPGNIVNGITENVSDFLSEAPEYGLGTVGGTVKLAGNVISADTDEMAKSGKNLGSDTWGLTKTVVGDAVPLGLTATGGGAMGMIPVDGIIRDSLAVSHMTANLIQKGKVGEVIPESLDGAIGYTIMRAMNGVDYADSVVKERTEKGNKAFVKESNNNQLLKKMQDKGRG